MQYHQSTSGNRIQQLPAGGSLTANAYNMPGGLGRFLFRHPTAPKAAQSGPRALPFGPRIAEPPGLVLSGKPGSVTLVEAKKPPDSFYRPRCRSVGFWLSPDYVYGYPLDHSRGRQGTYIVTHCNPGCRMDVTPHTFLVRTPWGSRFMDFDIPTSCGCA